MTAPNADMPRLLGRLPPTGAQRLREAENLLGERVLDAARVSSDAWAVLIQPPRRVRRLC